LKDKRAGEYFKNGGFLFEKTLPLSFENFKNYKIMDIIELLNKRYACKAMNGKAVPEEKIERIVEAVRLAPSANGLQPIELYVITNKALKEKIAATANGQIQVSTCSHLLVFTAWNTFTAERINEVFDSFKTHNGRETKPDYRNHVLTAYPSKSAAEQIVSADNQAFIALGVALVAVQAEGLDCCPMTGFQPKEVDKILNLSERGLHCVALLPVGYRDSALDWNEKLPKGRKAVEKFVTTLA
jgi:nitroreductase